MNYVSEGMGHVSGAVRLGRDQFHYKQQIRRHLRRRKVGGGGEESVGVGEDEIVEQFRYWGARRSCESFVPHSKKRRPPPPHRRLR